jgi:hypothetical protein
MMRKLVALSAIAAFSAAAYFVSAGPPQQALHEIGPAVTLVDAGGSDELTVRFPIEWTTVSASEVPDEMGFASWRAAHPEVPQDAATTLAGDTSNPGFSLLAYDPQGAVGGVTPQGTVIWIDAPASNLEAWTSKQAARLIEEYGPSSAPVCMPWARDPDLGVGAFQCDYLYTMHAVALAGSQMIVPMPDGRAAVLTFTWRADQADQFDWVTSGIVGSLSKGGRDS